MKISVRLPSSSISMATPLRNHNHENDNILEEIKQYYLVCSDIKIIGTLFLEWNLQRMMYMCRM